MRRKEARSVVRCASGTMIVLALLSVWFFSTGSIPAAASSAREWGSPEPLQTGVMNGPGDVYQSDIAVDGAGNAVAVWFQDYPPVGLVMANRFSKGSGWGSPVLLDTTAFVSGGASVAVDGQGNAIAVWGHDPDGQDGSAPTVIRASRYSVITGWGSGSVISSGTRESIEPLVALDAAGSATVVWSVWNGTEAGATGSSVWTNRYVRGVGWGTPVRIDMSNTSWASCAQVAVNPAGDAIVVWSQWYGVGDTSGIWASRYANSVWGVPSQLGEGGYPSVTIDADGNAIAVWSQSDLQEGIWSIQSSRFTPGVGWSPAEVIESVIGWGNQDVVGVGGPSIAMNPLGDAILVSWALYYGAGYQLTASLSTGGSEWGTPVRIGTPVQNSEPAVGVTIDSLGNAIVLWTGAPGRYDSPGPSRVWSARYEVGVGWEDERPIDLGVGPAWGPVVGSDSQGNVFVIWPQRYGPRLSLWSNTYDVNSGWGSAVLVVRATWGISAPQISAFGNGGAIAVWSQGDGTRSTVWANVRIGGIGWLGAAPVDANFEDEIEAQVGVNSQGSATVVWQQWDGVRYGVWSSHYETSGGWNTPTQLDTGSESAFSPQIAVNELGDAIAVWQQWNGTDYNIWANHYDASAGWDDAVSLENKSGWASSPKIGMDRYGNAVAIWTHDDPNFWSIRSIWSSRYTVGVGWTLAEEVAAVCSSDAQLAVDAEGDAIMTWGGGWGEYQGIWTNRFEHNVGWNGMRQLDNTSDYYPPHIAANRKGDAIVLWQSQVKWGWGEVWVARYSADNASGEWDPPWRIDPGEEVPEESPSVALDQSGNAVAVWIRWGEVYPQIWYPQVLSASYAIGDGWGFETTIWENPDHASDVSAPQVAMDYAGNAIVVWSESDETASSIWSNSYVVPIVSPDLSNIYHDLAFLRWVAIVNSVGVIVLASFVIVLLWMRWNRSSSEPREFRNDLRFDNPHSSNPTTGVQLGENNGTVLANGLAPEKRWPARAASGLVHLTAKERILLHLQHFARYADSSEVPPELTQERIAEAVGIDRRHFTQYVHPLEGDGLVRERTTHVRGVVQRRRVYVLTEEGERRTLGVRDRVRSATIRVRDTSGVREATVAEALLEARGSMSVLDILRESMEMGVVDLTR